MLKIKNCHYRKCVGQCKCLPVGFADEVVSQAGIDNLRKVIPTLSAAYITVLLEVMARPEGLSKVAVVPTPFADPAELPANTMLVAPVWILAV
jgi:hypothetical protein